MKLTSLRPCAAAFLFIGTAPLLQAQVISSTQIERNLTYPGSYSAGYESPSQRYSYKTGAFLYATGDSRNLIYLDYLDRADRARKFGYRMPIDPFFETPPPPAMLAPPLPEPAPVAIYPAEDRGFFGLGLFRRR
jgi:hypothetical protein